MRSWYLLLYDDCRYLRELQEVIHLWNTHRIRPCRNAVSPGFFSSRSNYDYRLRRFARFD
ncbi:hypothetical protein PAMA_002812 [Pampus argenteus]